MKVRTLRYTWAIYVLLLGTLFSNAQSFQVGIIAYAENNRFCEGYPEYFQLQANPSGGTAPYTYEWTFSWNNDTLTNRTITANPTSSGVVSLTVHDNSHPQKVKTVNFPITETVIDADFNFNPDGSCAQTPIEFTSIVSGGTPGYSYVWNFGDWTSSYEENPVHEFISSGCSGNSTFNVTMRVEDADGCETSVVRTVTVRNKPYLDFNDSENPFSPFKHCHMPGSADTIFDVVLENNSLNTACITSYEVDWGDGNVVTGASFPIRHTYAAVGAFEIVITAQNSTGCDLEWSKFVYNQSSPAGGVSSLGGTEGCAPTMYSFILNEYENNSIGTTYTWDFGDGSNTIVWDWDDPFDNNVISHTYDTTSCFNGGPQGDYTTMVTVNNGCGTRDLTANSVRVWQEPNAYLDDGNYTLDSICIDEVIQLANNSTSGSYGTDCSSHTEYLWDFGNGSTSDSETMPPMSWSEPGEYSIILDAGNPCGISSDTFHIVVMEPPVANATVNNTSGCAPFIPVFENNSTGEGIRYFWQITPSSGFTFLNGTSNSSSEPEIRFNGGGQYRTVLYVSNACNEADSVVFNFNVAAPPGGRIEDLPDVCSTDPVVHPTVVYNDFGRPVTSFNWNFTGGSPATASTEDPGEHSYASAGEYIVSLTLENECGSRSITDTFNVYNTPVVAVNTPVSICESNSYSITGTTASNFTSIVWETEGDGNFSDDSELNPVYYLGNDDINNAGTQLRIVAQSAGLCEPATAVIDLSIQQAPTAQVGEDVVICEDEAYDITDATATNYDVIQWSTSGDGYFSDPEILLPRYTPGPADLLAQHVELTLTSFAISPCLSNASSTFSITYASIPNINAGPDQDVCMDEPVPLSASGTGYVSLLWNAESGTGNFSNASSSSPVFTVNPGFSGDHIELTIEATGGYGCESAYDTVVLYAFPGPEVFAGIDVIICGEEAYDITDATADNYDAIQWSTSGDGYFSDPEILLPRYTPGPGDLAANHVELILTANAISPCTENASNTFSITYVNPPTIDAGPDMDVTMDEPIPLSASGTEFVSIRWNIENGMGSFSDPAGLSPEFTINPGFSGSFIELSIEATGGYGCDPAYDTITLFVYPSPVAFAGNDISICEGSDVSVTSASAEEFSEIFWTTRGSGTFEDENTLSPTYHPSNEDIENKQVVLILHARAIEPIEHIVVEDSITANIVHNASADVIPFDAICEGETYQINDVEYEDVNMITWSSSGDGYLEGTNEANPVYTFSASDLEADTVYFYLEVSSIEPCTHEDYDTLMLRSINKPDPSFDYDNPEGCAPLHVNFTNTSGGDELVYYWDLGNGFDSNNEDPGEIVFQQGKISDTTYTVTLNTSNQCDSLSASRDIIVKPVPVTDFGMDVEWGCSIKEIQFFNVTTGLPDTYTWNWGDGSEYSSDEQPGFHAFETGDTDTIYTITLFAENECGVDSMQKHVQIFPSTVNAFFETDTTFGCAPFEVSFTNYSRGVLGDEPFLNWSWNFGDGNISDELDPMHEFLNPGLYTVTLHVNDTCSTDFFTTEIHVMGAPEADFITDREEYCQYDSVFVFPVDLPLDEIASVSWDFGDSTQGHDYNDVHIFDTSGEFTITLTVKDIMNGCTSNTSGNVTINKAPVAAFSIPENDGCPPLKLTLINESEGGEYYAWDYGNENISIDINGYQEYMEAGDYNIILNVTDSRGCNDTVSHNIHVNPKPTAAFESSSLLTCFPPVDIEFNNLSEGADDYVWDFGDGTTCKDTDPAITYSDYGDYNISLVATNMFLCKDTGRMVYHVYHNPVAEFTVDSTIGCDPYTVPLINLSEYGVEYHWNFDDQEVSEVEAPEYTFSGEGVYSISLKVVGLGGCADSITMFDLITVNPSPVADFEYTRINDLDTIQFHNYSLGAISYLWDFGDGQSSEESDPLYRFLHYGSYYVGLTAINEYNCTNTLYDSINFELFKGLYIPNAFAPENVSEEVREFKAVGIGLITYHLVVYDTWGNLIWETTELENSSPAEGWDGTLKGEALLPDVYVWHLREAIFKDGSSYTGPRYGTVTLIR